MKIKLKILFTAVCISLTLQVNAIQSIQIEKNAALTLNDCIKIALNNSPVVKKYILNLDIAKSSVGVANKTLEKEATTSEAISREHFPDLMLHFLSFYGISGKQMQIFVWKSSTELQPNLISMKLY